MSKVIATFEVPKPTYETQYQDITGEWLNAVGIHEGLNIDGSYTHLPSAKADAEYLMKIMKKTTQVVESEKS